MTGPNKHSSQIFSNQTFSTPRLVRASLLAPQLPVCASRFLRAPILPDRARRVVCGRARCGDARNAGVHAVGCQTRRTKTCPGPLPTSVCESCASGAPARRARSTALLCEHAALLLCGRLRCGEVVVRCGLVCQVFEGSRCGAGLVVRSGRSCALSSASRSVVRWFACCTGLLAPKRGALRFRSGEERPALNLTQLSDFNSSLSSPWSRSLHAPTP